MNNTFKGISILILGCIISSLLIMLGGIVGSLLMENEFGYIYGRLIAFLGAATFMGTLVYTVEILCVKSTNSEEKGE